MFSAAFPSNCFDFSVYTVPPGAFTIAPSPYTAVRLYDSKFSFETCTGSAFLAVLKGISVSMLSPSALLTPLTDILYSFACSSCGRLIFILKSSKILIPLTESSFSPSNSFIVSEFTVSASILSVKIMIQLPVPSASMSEFSSSSAPKLSPGILIFNSVLTETPRAFFTPLIFTVYFLPSSSTGSISFIAVSLSATTCVPSTSSSPQYSFTVSLLTVSASYGSENSMRQNPVPSVLISESPLYLASKSTLTTLMLSTSAEVSVLADLTPFEV